MIKLLKGFILFACCLFCLGISPVQAETVYFQWLGQAGYSLKGCLNYEKPIINQYFKVKNTDQIQALETLIVSFYQPDGKLIENYENIRDRHSAETYLQFTFDAAQKQFLGKIDLGGSQPGQIYLKGEMKKQLQLIQIDLIGKEKVVDQNQAWIATASLF